jgi:hypothetical protein
MATLREYYLKDASRYLTANDTWELRRRDGSTIVQVLVKQHFDFEANAKYLSFYVPFSPESGASEDLLLQRWEEALRIGSGLYVATNFAGAGDTATIDTLQFTGRIFLYSERPMSAEDKEQLQSAARRRGHYLVLRGIDYQEARNRMEKPLAFICHDSRDKKDIAEPLAFELQGMMCPVWYDEFQLKVGDSLRESIERGIRECKKCILILTPNFLGNNRWTKREYDSIFTREMVEEKKVILPVWSGVGPQDLYQYSPILADRVAANWSLGKTAVARRLLAAITVP